MCSEKVTICNSEGEAVSEQWDEFVSQAPMATISHLYGWRNVISQSYKHRTFYLTAQRHGAVVGVLPLVHIRSLLFGNTLVSMPFQDYGGIVARDEEALRALLDHALQLKKELGAHSLELRDRMRPAHFHPDEESVEDVYEKRDGKFFGDKVTLLLDISVGVENLWKSFSPKVRNQVRKAQKAGLSTQIGGMELLEAFYRPFSVNMRDLGSPVHHLNFFRKVFSVFGEGVRVVLVQEREQTIGGLIAFFFKNNVVVPWASCYRQHFSKCPNNLLYWDAMQYAFDHGCHTFDFGRSSVGSGTYNFKTQWGARPEPLHWRRFSDGNASVALESHGFPMAATLWKHIPVEIATGIGSYLRRYIAN
ncbi:MAG: FemAB family PEP-CTERM system-associated protein [Acidobacteriota bacterium]|jgi:FemAB-related protein (PEP-CTERM system-associated)|nr:FemAB family PEP-CTERM system-associated protein [Acidobacteriota bacterium]